MPNDEIEKKLSFTKGLQAKIIIKRIRIKLKRKNKRRPTTHRRESATRVTLYGKSCRDTFNTTMDDRVRLPKEVACIAMTSLTL
jgi:hypothetical protein